ncbi:solute carrier family 15 member 3-like [Corticium candelabrum]|uniref:solute carrier family 15 member 3-like n=1 Tax=Corticium candelabrum TaxID=121492 RepID=UPI002E3468F6|nr:solute carrier family 15 member 3-like [Corticium candelabrum]
MSTRSEDDIDDTNKSVPLLRPVSSLSFHTSLARLRQIINRQRDVRAVIRLMASQALMAIAFYLIEYNLVTYCRLYIHLKGNLILMVFYRGTAFFLAPVFGWISDAKTGHYKVLLTGITGFLFGSSLLCVTSYLNALPSSDPLDGSVTKGQVGFIIALLLCSVSHAATLATFMPYILVSLTATNTTEGVLAHVFSCVYFAITVGGLIAAVSGGFLQALHSPWRVSATHDRISIVHHTECYEAYTGFFYVYLLATVCSLAAFLILVIWRKQFYRHTPAIDYVPRLTSIVMLACCPRKEMPLPYDRNLLPQHEPESQEEQAALNRADHYKRLSVLVPKLIVFILFGMGIAQIPSTFVEQGSRMNHYYTNEITNGSGSLDCSTHFSNSNIYSQSLQESAKSAVILVFIPIIIFVIKPLYTKWTRSDFTMLVRIRYGLVFAVLASIAALVVEWQRIHCAGCRHRFNQTNPILLKRGNAIIVVLISPLSVLYQIPQYVLFGMAEAFALLAAWEFVLSRSPQEFRSLSFSVLIMMLGIGTYLGSAVVAIIEHFNYYYEPFYIPTDGKLTRRKLRELTHRAVTSKAYVYYIVLTAAMSITLVIYVCVEYKHKDVVRVSRLPAHSKRLETHTDVEIRNATRDS